MSNFYKRYTELCAEKGFTPSGAAAAIGLSNAAANGWKNGKFPTDVTLAKLSALFGCSVEYLAGEKEKPTTALGDGFSDEQKLIFNKLMALPQEEREKKLQAIRLILDL